MASPEDPKRSKLPRGNALLGVLLIASALIAGLYVHEGSAGPVHAVRGGIAAVLSPATLLGGAVSGGESAASDALENAAADDASYSELKDENARLRAAVIEMEEGQAEALGIWRGSIITTTETTTGSSLLPDALPGAEHSYAPTPPVPQAALRA